LTTTVPPLRSPEKVLHTIAATARLSGLAAPRRISFDEPRPGEPLPVLSLSWSSLADMRPWLSVFHIDPHRPGASTVYGDHGGWSLMLTSPPPAACACEVVHPLGCPGDVPEHLADHFAVDLQAAPECPSCGVLNGSHQPHCYAVSRVDVEAAAQIPVVVIELAADAPVLHCFWRDCSEPQIGDAAYCGAHVHHLLTDTDDTKYACGAEGGGGSQRLNEVDCPACRTVALTLPQRTPGAALVDEPIPFTVVDVNAPIDLLPAEVVAAIANRHQPVPVVDVLTVDPDLPDDRSGAEMAHLNGGAL
jgi:hypothetical protein